MATQGRLEVGLDIVNLNTEFSFVSGSDYLVHQNGGVENIYITEQAADPTDKSQGRLTLEPGGYLLLENRSETFYAYTERGLGFMSSSVQS